jgi:hypothetical protein
MSKAEDTCFVYEVQPTETTSFARGFPKTLPLLISYEGRPHNIEIATTSDGPEYFLYVGGKVRVHPRTECDPIDTTQWNGNVERSQFLCR